MVKALNVLTRIGGGRDDNGGVNFWYIDTFIKALHRQKYPALPREVIERFFARIVQL